MNAADWKAPQNDGELLVWPSLHQLAESARENHRRLSSIEIIIAGQPWRIWREQTRKLLGHSHSEQLLISSGHQSELYHPGVWIKLGLVDRLARMTHGRAYQIAVDSDSPKHLQLRIPGENIELVPGSNTAEWTGRLSSLLPSRAYEVLEQIQPALRQWNFPTLLPSFFQHLAEKSPGEPDLPSALSDAMQQLDQQLGISYELAMTQEIWSSHAYLAFVLHLANNAAEFAACYNRALADYRRRERIKSPGRPMPDLRSDYERIELPFWLDDLKTGGRQRLNILCSPGRCELELGRTSFDFSKSSAEQFAAFCSENQIRVAPRALSLTMFIRLFAADQWIHGIGGARYDQVTDQIIREFFHIAPPAFGVTTATLYFPSAAHRQRTSLPAVKHIGHQLRHRVLGPAKDEYLQEINSAPRRSAARADAFAKMHHAMDRADSSILAAWSKQWAQSQITAAHDRALFDRELFYAIQSPDRLAALMQKIH